MLRSICWGLAVVCGLVLLAMPWLHQPSLPMPAPARFDRQDPVYGDLLAAATAVDAHCRKGDVARLQDWVTGDCMRRVQVRLRQSGRRLSGEALVGQFLVGRVADGALLAGGAKDNRAVLVHRRDRSDLDETGFLSSVEFVWNGRRWLFDKRSFRRVDEAGQAEGELAGAYLAELLGR